MKLQTQTEIIKGILFSNEEIVELKQLIYKSQVYCIMVQDCDTTDEDECREVIEKLKNTRIFEKFEQFLSLMESVLEE